MQSKDFELEEEHLERQGYAVGNKRMLVRSRDNYLILMRPEVNTEKSRSKSKQIVIFRVQLFNIRTTNAVRTTPISLACPQFLGGRLLRGGHKAAYMQPNLCHGYPVMHQHLR